MRYKTIIAVLMLAALLLTGCGGKTEENADATATPPAVTATPETTPESTTPPTPEVTKAPEPPKPPTQTPETTPVPSTEPTPQPEAGTDLAACKADMVSQLGLTDVVEMSVDRLSALYGIAADQVVQSASFVAASGAAFPMEIVMVEAASEDAAADIQTRLENRLAAIEEQASSYDPDSTALAQACSVRRDGCFVAMFFSSYHGEMDGIYAGYLK